MNAVGYCVGGTLLAITLGYMAATGDKRIASATLLTAQIDFEYAGDLKVFADSDRIASLEAGMKKRGYLEGSKMATAFNLLRSNELIWPYVVNDYLKGKEPLPFDLLYWNADATRMPSANHSFYLRNCYLENNLSGGRLTIAGKNIDLSRVAIPVYNLATREDHIAPAKSVFIGSRSLGGPVRFVLTGSGHIAGVVNPPARRKYQYWTGGAPKGSLEDWMAKAEEHAGLLVGRLAGLAGRHRQEADQEEAPSRRRQAEADRKRARILCDGAGVKAAARNFAGMLSFRFVIPPRLPCRGGTAKIAPTYARKSPACP